MIWMHPVNHATECYFCICKPFGFGDKKKWIYPTVSTRGFGLRTTFTVPLSLQKQRSENTEDKCEMNEYEIERNPRLFSQSDVDDLVRELELTKHKAQLLVSRLKERCFLEPNVKSTIYRKRHEKFATYYSIEEDICVSSVQSGGGVRAGKCCVVDCIIV